MNELIPILDQIEGLDELSSSVLLELMENTDPLTENYSTLQVERFNQLLTALRLVRDSGPHF